MGVPAEGKSWPLELAKCLSRRCRGSPFVNYCPILSEEEKRKFREEHPGRKNAPCVLEACQERKTFSRTKEGVPYSVDLVVAITSLFSVLRWRKAQ